MPTYYWTGINAHGSEQNGTSHASSIEQLKHNLLSQNIALLTYTHTQEQKKSNLLSFLSEKKVSDQLLSTFFDHMAILVCNGVDISHALKLFAEQTSHNTFKKCNHTTRN